MAADPKSRLGRGLSSLISAAAAPTGAGTFFECEIDRIDAMPGQPRSHFEIEALQELADSIRASGVIQPLVVRQRDGGRFGLVAGERRLRAARLAGLATVPVVVRELTDADAFAAALIENIQRRDLNPIEEAVAYQRLLDEHGFRQEDLAQRVGRSRPAVANALRLLRLPEGVRLLVARGELSAGHARAILSVPDDAQVLFASRVVEDELNVRQAEDAARVLRDPPPSPPAPEPPAPKKSDLAPVQTSAVKAAQRMLTERYGLRATISQRSNGSGTLAFEFVDMDALKDLVDALLSS